MDGPEDRPAAFAPFVAKARWDLREAVAGLLAARLDAGPAGAARPPFLDAASLAKAQRAVPDPARPSELRAYARPSSAPARAQYRLRTVLGPDLAPAAFVGRAYEAVLGRAADAEGAAGYVEAVGAGRLSRRGLLEALARSDEGKARGLDFVFLAAAAGPDA
ncbi:DUF4214 domain-containing protein [Methylobacterium sp. sgz302541]|uniref:DUF4214 domain-containing protein n=1 Tax=unclassified Methylobacterium TaxID=2615210 RepID=UPI003D328A64